MLVSVRVEILTPISACVYFRHAGPQEAWGTHCGLSQRSFLQGLHAAEGKDPNAL